MTIEKHTEQMQEKLTPPTQGGAISSDLDAALNGAIAAENTPPPGAAGAMQLMKPDPKAVTAAVCAEIGVKVGEMVEKAVPEIKGRISGKEWSDFGAAIGETLAFYGITISDDAMHPLWKVGLSGAPILMAALVVRDLKKAAADAPPAPAAPGPVAPPAAQTAQPGFVYSGDPAVSVRHMDASQPAEPYSAPAEADQP